MHSHRLKIEILAARLYRELRLLESLEHDIK